MKQNKWFVAIAILVAFAASPFLLGVIHAHSQQDSHHIVDRDNFFDSENNQHRHHQHYQLISASSARRLAVQRIFEETAYRLVVSFGAITLDSAVNLSSINKTGFLNQSLSPSLASMAQPVCANRPPPLF